MLVLIIFWSYAQWIMFKHDLRYSVVALFSFLMHVSWSIICVLSFSCGFFFNFIVVRNYSMGLEHLWIIILQDLQFSIIRFGHPQIWVHVYYQKQFSPCKKDAENSVLDVNLTFLRLITVICSGSKLNVWQLNMRVGGLNPRCCF